MTVDEKNIFNSISGDQNREKKLEFLLNLYNKNSSDYDVLFYIIKYMIPKITTNIEYISISMIIGGTLGNLFDRVYHNYVIDFISLNIFGYNFPVFNFADILITCGAIILIIILIRSDKSANNRGQK